MIEQDNQEIVMAPKTQFEKEIDHLICQAHQFYLDQNHVLAYQIFKKVNEMCPTHATPYFFLGIYEKKENIEKKIQYFEKCTTLFPTTFHPMALCKWGYLLIGKIEIENKQQQAIDIDPKIIEKWHIYSKYLTKLEWIQLLLSFQNTYEQQILELIQQELQRDENDPYIYYQWGNYYLINFKYKEAKEIYQKGLEKQSDFWLIKNNLSFVLNQLQEYEEALKIGLGSIKLNSKNHTAYNNVGNALTKLGKLDEAINYYKKTIELSPSFPTAYMNITYPLTKQGKTQEAIQYLETLLHYIYDTNDLLKINFVMGEIYFQENKYDIALQKYLKCYQIYDEQPRILYCIGMCYLKLKVYNQALRFFKLVLTNDKSFTFAYSQIGYISIIQKNFEQAIEYYEKAQIYKKNDQAIQQNLAYCYLQVKNYKKAVYYYLKLVTSNIQNMDLIMNQELKSTIKNMLNLQEKKNQIQKNSCISLRLLKQTPQIYKRFRSEITQEISEFLVYNINQNNNSNNKNNIPQNNSNKISAQINI
ncbi:hypothetical protein PPERSA_04329 [Pseudocohnilembus persalinus]|uniref:Uncharacterized protein n=1 Tax=Pseudocohnilembus persalinus TaxID=266149 RepID=A0A0V0QQD3_PSEPJ|nr:hypothetical protein PPERSA_04329 [Pseudocohnilembus persalinus]|eukprot:KRX04514.1 hypothetical protein PPERSA_04329 [Pseudocohnilembus persalinus]